MYMYILVSWPYMFMWIWNVSLIPNFNSILQACEGSIAQLRQFLLEMNRRDAINIIDHALTQLESEKSSRSSGEGSSTSHTRSKCSSLS